MASSISKIIMGAMVVVGFSSCHERPVVLNVVDPGHFHAGLLQKSRLDGNDSMLSRMVAPVVLKPDIVSKKAFVTEGMLPLKM